MNIYEVKQVMKKKEPYLSVPANDAKHAAILYCRYNHLTSATVHVRKHSKFLVRTDESDFRKKVLIAEEV